METAIILISAYFLGAVPFAFLVSKLWAQTDIRLRGSGNVGATNVARVAGPLAGIVVLLLDASKGYLAIILAARYSPEMIYWAGLFVVIGHCWSIFLRFQGGKGVATTLGVIAALEPLYLIFLLLAWLAVFLVFRIVSLASITTAAVLPLILFFRGAEAEVIIFVALYALVIILRHNENIRRLLRGEEGSFRKGK